MLDRADNKYLLVVIGGGAAGMTAAISAARTWYDHVHNDRQADESAGRFSQAPVAILEKLDRPGRKLLATGNGRCNLSNSQIDLTRYHGQDKRFAKGALSRMNVDATREWFSQIGLPCRVEPDGRIFPESLQASSVLDILRREIHRLQVPIITNSVVNAIEIIDNKDHCFLISDKNGKKILAERVIAATGGMAAPAFGCDGSGYELFCRLGHNMTGIYPSLVQVKTEQSWNSGLAGCKFVGRASFHNKKMLRCDEGEILFTNYGLSGPPILQISRQAAIASEPEGANSGSFIRLDFLPYWTEEQLCDWFKNRQQHDPDLELADFLIGLLAKKIGRALLKLAVVRQLSATAASLTTEEIRKLARAIKGSDLQVTGTLSWDQAQVTAGGLVTNQFSPTTFESQLVKGLYAAGEILDIDGDCGGFNLQWAWSSGYIAGSKAMLSAIEAKWNH